MAKGKLIVFEGIDGSGKSAQYRRLYARMEKDGIGYHHIVFPRYDKESSALIRMYLGGQFGTKPADVTAYAALLVVTREHDMMIPDPVLFHSHAEAAVLGGLAAAVDPLEHDQLSLCHVLSLYLLNTSPMF